MVKIKFTKALRRFFPTLQEETSASITIHEILSELDLKYPGIKSYIVDEQNILRKHVNIFIDGEIINDRTTLSDTFTPNSEIYFIQALSGG